MPIEQYGIQSIEATENHCNVHIYGPPKAAKESAATAYMRVPSKYKSLICELPNMEVVFSICNSKVRSYIQAAAVWLCDREQMRAKVICLENVRYGDPPSL